MIRNPTTNSTAYNIINLAEKWDHIGGKNKITWEKPSTISFSKVVVLKRMWILTGYHPTVSFALFPCSTPYSEHDTNVVCLLQLLPVQAFNTPFLTNLPGWNVQLTQHREGGRLALATRASRTDPSQICHVHIFIFLPAQTDDYTQKKKANGSSNLWRSKSSIALRRLRKRPVRLMSAAGKVGPVGHCRRAF